MNKKLRAYFLLFIIWALLVIALFFIFQPRQKFLEVDFLDVGQGDAELIKTPYGQKILIDGGPTRAAVIQELGKVLPFWERKIDLVILTHCHSDHFVGLVEVFKRYDVGTIIIGTSSSTDEDYLYFLDAAMAEKADFKKAPGREKIVLGDNCSLEIFNPAFWGAPKDANELSLVSDLDCGEKILFMGDAGVATEKIFLANNFISDTDILKVGHHGSAGASSDEFLQAVQPETLMILAGVDNSYGLPSPEALYRLKKTNAKIFRTDFNGLIKVKDNKGKIEISSEK
ncbi:MAG: MBL fold metallo-hydrolase [Patescibacteria group bacterium]|jgi:competence protein ComEC